MGIPATLSTVPAQTPYIQYVATSGQTVFPYPFEITQDSDLVAVANGTTLATDSGYTLSGVGNSTGGNLTFTSGRTAGDIITLYRDIPIERLTQFAQNGGFSSTAFNAEFNNVYLLLQQLQQNIDQCLQIPNTNNPAPTVSLTPGAYANKYLAFDASGNPTPATLTASGSVTQAYLGTTFYPVVAAEGSTVVQGWYPYGCIDRYGVNTTPGTTDMSTALTNALAANSVVTALAATYKLATTSGFTLKGKRIQGAGRHATIFQVPNIAASTNAFSVQSVSGGYDTSAPGISGCQILGNGNTNAGANGVALISSDGGGCHGGVFSDVIVGGFKGTGSSGWLLSASLSNGIYDNVFINCFGGPTTTNSTWANTVAWTLTTTDAPTQPNRCNNNTWIGGGGFFSTGDGAYINYASENSFYGFDREQNGGWGFNIQGICPGTVISGGDSESNTSGSINKASSSSDVHVFGGNVTEAAGGNWNQYDHYFPGGTQAGKFGVDNSGNVTIAGTKVNITGANPNFQAGAANYLGLDTTDGLIRCYKAPRFDSTVIASASTVTLASVTTKVVETTVSTSISTITAFPAAVDGMEISWMLKQGSGGSNTVGGWPANVLLAGGAFTLTATANKMDILTFRYNGDFAKWFEVSRSQNM